jgi:type 1 fimbria pilin
MKIIFIILTTLLLLSCAYSSDVVKMGSNTYSVSGTAGSERGGKFGAKQVAIEEASSYCQKQGKQVNVTQVETATINSIGTGSANISFQCVP